MADTGLRIRFAPVRGETPKHVLSSPVYLPAVLGEFSLDEDGAHTDYDTVRMGEYSVPQFGERRDMRKLRAADLEALTIYWPAPWAHPTHQSADWVEDQLYSILRARRPVEMLVRIHQMGWDDVIVRMKVTFRSVRQTIKPGEADTKYWSVSTKEWRPNTEARRKAGGAVKLPTTHKLTAADTLEKLSKKYYGSYAGWRAIAQENGLGKWGKTTPLVQTKRYKVGSKIKIPRKPPIAHTNPKGTGGTRAP